MISQVWQMRLLIALLFVAVQEVHKGIFGNLPATDFGQLIYHASAALADFTLIYTISCLTTGRLALDLERLCLASMVSNVFGWIFFTAYLPPTMYNIVAGTIVYVQLLRLFYIGRYDADYSRAGLVCGPHIGRTQFHHSKAYQ